MAEQPHAAPVQCAITGCPDRVLARGWCARHYRRWQRHGDPRIVRYAYGERNGMTRPEVVDRQIASTRFFDPPPRRADPLDETTWTEENWAHDDRAWAAAWAEALEAAKADRALGKETRRMRALLGRDEYRRALSA